MDGFAFFFFAFTIHFLNVGKHRARRLPCWRGRGEEGSEEENIALVTVFSLTVGAIATEKGIVSHAQPMMNSE